MIFGFALCLQLPQLQDDGPASDFYGRFSNTERRPQRGGSRDSRGGSSRSSSRDWLSSDDGNDGFSRGGRSSNRNENSWSRNSRSGGSDWLIGGGDRRSSRSPSFGNKDRYAYILLLNRIVPPPFLIIGNTSIFLR